VKATKRPATAAVLIVVAAILVAVLAVAVAGPRDVAAPSPSPSPMTSTPTPSASSTPAPTASASPLGVVRFASPGLGYSIETPLPWHRSTCSAALITQQGTAPASEEFVPVSARDETATDIGPAYPRLRVDVFANPQNLSARGWAQQDLFGLPGTRVEDVTYADRPAARKVAPGTPLASYYVANGGRMYVVAPQTSAPNSPPAGNTPEQVTLQAMLRMIESFRFHTDAEQAAARAAVPAPLPPRTPEQVADGVAAAFAAKDAAALAGFLSACPVTGGENAGGSFVSREKYVDDLRAAFAAGLVVTVQPRPLDGDRSTGNLTVASTWQDSRGTKARKLMLVRGQNDRWEWLGTLERFT
jgi:hypothetical protein